MENNVYYILLNSLYSIEKNEKKKVDWTQKKFFFSSLINAREFEWNERKIVFILLLLLKSFSPFLWIRKTIIFILVKLKENLHKSLNIIFYLFLYSFSAFHFLFCFICKWNLITLRNYLSFKAMELLGMMNWNFFWVIVEIKLWRKSFERKRAFWLI